MKKLNLGCGGDYKKDYFNVDGFDKTVADQTMQAYNLEIEDDSYDEILLSQLIEHLGLVGSHHSLSECFRVLKPGGKLVIETPDLKKTFEKYLQGGLEGRKNTLPWIYGVDIPGMVHRFCYPDDLLEITLKKLGFVEIEKDNFEIDQYEPVLKVTCKKPQNVQAFQIVTHFKKKLLENGIIDLDDQLISLEKHDLIDVFTTETNKFLEKKDNQILHNLFCNGALVDPKITRFFVEELKAQKIVEDDFLNKYIEMLATLEELDFPNILLTTMMKIQGFAGEQKKLYIQIDELALAMINKIINEDGKENVLEKLKDISRTLNEEDKIGFLSDKMIMLKSNRFFQIGVKFFIQENYNKAVEMFEKSISLFRNQLLSFWNLARIYKILGDLNKAKSFYEDSVTVANNIDIENKSNILKFLDEETKNQDKTQFTDPITSYIEIL